MPPPNPVSTDPLHIAVSKSKGMIIDWADGHRSEYSNGRLRDQCPCATCTGSHGTVPQKTDYSAPPAGPFQMYRPKLKMEGVEAVGAYAVRIRWSDGHNTGIYSFAHLRGICPCAECRTQAGERPR
jgi:DUF971 family protein